MICEGREAYTFMYYYTCLQKEGIHYEPYSCIPCQVLTRNNGIKIRRSFKWIFTGIIQARSYLYAKYAAAYTFMMLQSAIKSWPNTLVDLQQV